jgi:hypothetical protein
VGAVAGSQNPAFDEDEEPYVEYNPATASLAFLNRLTKGWTAYVVAVVKEEQQVSDSHSGSTSGSDVYASLGGLVRDITPHDTVVGS